LVPAVHQDDQDYIFKVKVPLVISVY